MIRGFILLAFVFISAAGISQTGYLGDLNAIEFKINASPSRLRYRKIVDVDGELRSHRSLRYVMPSFELNYARTISRSIELSLGAEFAAIRLVDSEVHSNYISNKIMLDALKAKSIGANFEFRYYRKGCFSPIGKFIGASLHYGVAKVNTDDGLIYGSTGSSIVEGGYFEKTNFFNRKNEVTYADTLYDMTRSTSRYTSVRLNMGRNYPLGNGLTLNLGISAPLLTYYNGGFGGKTGFSLWGDNNTVINDGRLENSLRYTLHKYNRIQLNISIKKYF